MLLAGIALSALANAVTGVLIFIADDKQLRDLTFWGLGSLAGANWTKILSAGPIILVSLAVVPFLARGLNALTLGEAAAFHMGIPVQRLKNIAIVSVAASTGASVAVSGGIGFVGIVVPHVLRLVIGPDHRYLLPASALLGGTLLIFADMIARTIVPPAELPIGIITAFVGAPFFLWILLRGRSHHGALRTNHDQASNLSVRLSGKQVLHGVNIEAAAGQLTAIVGPNGSGKTTSLKAIAGELSYDGTVSINGHDILTLKPWELALKRAVLPQSTVISFPFTVREIVRMGLSVGAKSRGR